MRKKQSLAHPTTDALLTLKDNEFVRTVREIFEVQSPAEWACSLVSYESVVSLIRLDRKSPDDAKKIPISSYGVDQMLLLIEPYMYLKTRKEAKARLRALKNISSSDNWAYEWLVFGFHNKEPASYPTEHGWMFPRAIWNWSALLVMRAEEKAEAHAEIEDDLAKIWICLIKGCALLPDLLRQNRIWTETEKSTFNKMPQNKTEHCMNIFMPKILHKNHLINEFAESNGLEYLVGSFCPRQ